MVRPVTRARGDRLRSISCMVMEAPTARDRACTTKSHRQFYDEYEISLIFPTCVSKLFEIDAAPDASQFEISCVVALGWISTFIRWWSTSNHPGIQVLPLSSPTAQQGFISVIALIVLIAHLLHLQSAHSLSSVLSNHNFICCCSIATQYFFLTGLNLAFRALKCPHLDRA